MRIALIFTFLTFIMILSTSAQKTTKYYGHRGCRGLYPENTLPGFQKALTYDVDGIEWDVVVSKDGQLVISHEPYFEAKYCLTKDGKELNSKEGKQLNFYQLTADEIATIDCGSKFYKSFPEQEKIKAYKPTVKEAFKTLSLGNADILFEVKSEAPDYGVYQPEPKEFAKLIADEISDFEKKEQIIFMSFDPILLNELHEILPMHRYVYLTYHPFTSIHKFLGEINFTPFALGMYHVTITKKDVRLLHEKEIQAFAWTVNSQKVQDKMIRYGVDGIITDYPDRIK